MNWKEKGTFFMIYVFLADGFEETEAIAPIDMLRRAKKEVVTVGVTGKVVTSSHGVPVTADITQDEIQLNDQLEMIVLPGGMPGTLNEEASEQVQAAITYCAEQNRYLTAICAAPSILGHRGLLNGKHAVCYPGFESALTGAEVGTEGVVQDGNIITARGAGVAIDFGLALVAALCGAEKSAEIRKEIVYA
jgi:4-methyl-5(b-hydroxyethyl)-thiazole monophosphate biosynthesis